MPSCLFWLFFSPNHLAKRKNILRSEYEAFVRFRLSGSFYVLYPDDDIVRTVNDKQGKELQAVLHCRCMLLDASTGELAWRDHDYLGRPRRHQSCVMGPAPTTFKSVLRWDLARRYAQWIR